ncbi:MAG: hypothetical protein IT427_11740 [Pirellulales bacterium]|nr:hypothetical protein [Pirellulales bacterium]
MHDILLHYERVKSGSWAYLASLLIITLYFKFSRVWSVRNLDLIGLILLTPGLIFVISGHEKGIPAFEQTGYIWLFVVGGLFVVRMLLDPLMVRRPLLEPNLSVGGLTFLGVSLLVFLMANVLTEKTPSPGSIGATAQVVIDPAAAGEANANPNLAKTDSTGVPAAADPAPEKAEAAASAGQSAAADEPLLRYGPGYPWFIRLWRAPVRLFFTTDSDQTTLPPGESTAFDQASLYAAHAIAILSHLAIIVGMIVIGYRHFDNIKTGIAAAVLYLLVPYTAMFTDRAYDVLPAALLIWTVVMYRRPLVAGILMGVAVGTTYYAVFLLPLWCGFYAQRGIWRFVGGVLAVLGIMVVVLYFNPESGSFMADLRQMFGWIFPRIKQDQLHGFWGLPYNDPVYRIPVLAAFVVMCVTLAIWPAQKNLGTLMSCSAAVMIGTQFWHPLGGGIHMAWYLPLMLLTVFRPNLEDRIALSVLGEWTFAKRKPRLAA